MRLPSPLEGEGVHRSCVAAEADGRGVAMPNLRARRLRWDMTDDERRLWALLRRKQLAGYRFRRQHPMGSYVADFFCPNAKLIVELDGGQHSEDKQMHRDEIRSRWLA